MEEGSCLIRVIRGAAVLVGAYRAIYYINCTKCIKQFILL